MLFFSETTLEIEYNWYIGLSFRWLAFWMSIGNSI